MAKAIWNGAVIAESDQCEMVDGNHYFPPDSVNRDLLKPSATHTVCPWKGQADYYTLVVDGQENPDAAWCYPQTKPEADNIQGYLAFWRGVSIED